MNSPVVWTLALATAAVAGLWSMLGDDSTHRAERATTEVATLGTLDFADAGSSRLFPKTEQPEPETTSPDVAAEPTGLVTVTLHIQYTNGERPRAILLAHKHDGRKADAILGRNPDRSGVFRIHLKPGSHHVRWFFDRVALHHDDPLPLGTPEWTIDTANPSTWDWTVPVAAEVLVRDPARGLPELWLNGVRVKPKWEEGSSRYRRGPMYLNTAHGSLSKIALVEPGTYTIYRGNGAGRWCRTVVLNATEPLVLNQGR